MATTSPITKRLKEARIAAGMSQKELGITAGIDEFSASARMNQYETGKHSPDFLTVKRIAEALRLPTAFFYAESEELAYAIKLFSKLKVSNRRKALEYLQRELE